MTWEKPEFVEIKMDCEINSYQDDFQRDDFCCTTGSGGWSGSGSSQKSSRVSA